MTPEERDRLTRVETRMDGLDDWLRSIDGKLEDLRTAAAMGKGAWWLMLRIGAMMAAVAAFIAWIIDHLGGKHP